MFSLKNTPASTAFLLLKFEGVATTIVAVVVFKEFVEKRIWIAVLLITMASIMLSWGSSGQWGFSLGAIGVLGACILWGIDNSFPVASMVFHLDKRVFEREEIYRVGSRLVGILKCLHSKGIIHRDIRVPNLV